MAKPEYLYSKQEDNAKLKEAAAKAGMPIKFDRDRGAYAMQTEGMSKEDVAAKKEQLGEFRGEKARKAWAADREDVLAAKEALRAEAKKRESTTQEPKKVRANDPDTYEMFPAPSQKADFRKTLRETGSSSAYQAETKNHKAHFRVRTMEPEKFAAYMGAEAEKRFVREYEEKMQGTPKQNSNEATEVARDEARTRAAKAFMAQYQDRGFRLSDAKRDKDNHGKQLEQMRSATPAQLLAVIGKSREIVTELRDKEANMRAEAGGISVEQVKAMSFADQKKIVDAEGKPVGLVGDDFSVNVQLSRGIRAINTELEARGIRNKSADREQEQDQEKGKSNDKGQAQSNDKAQNQSQGNSKGPAKVSQEESVDNDVALANAFAAQGRGRGR